MSLAGDPWTMTATRRPSATNRSNGSSSRAARVFRLGAPPPNSSGHPGAREAAVVGLPDDDLGQRIVAFVVASAGLQADELIDHVARELSAHKRPREVRIVDALPRNAMNRVVRAELTGTLPG